MNPQDNSSQDKRQSCLFVISAPSGTGKSTLCKAVRNHFPDMLYSISFTTRKPRSGEQNGIDYHFVAKEDFIERIKLDKWAEWAEVHGNYYGTSADFINAGLSSGRDILLDIDVQGTEKILKRYPDCIPIFIMPPSLEALKQRLKNRGTESSDEIKRRLKAAEAEIAKKHVYRHIIINDRLTEAEHELIALLDSYRLTQTKKP